MSLQFFFKDRGVGVMNYGISFGWLKSIWIVVIAMMLVIFTYFVKVNKRGGYWLLVMSGGMANLGTRVFLAGGVWDYIHLPFLGLWCNGADFLIVVGTVGLILKYIHAKS